MAIKSANLYARIEPEVKEQAEKILSALGIPASSAINMFYKQVILHKGLPFDVKLPYTSNLDNKKEETVATKEHPIIMVFNVTAMAMDYDGYTNLLVSKMYAFAKEHGIDVTIRMESASKINTKGKEADILLLAPCLASMEEETKALYPDKIVKVMDEKDYGFLNGGNILSAALS